MERQFILTDYMDDQRRISPVTAEVLAAHLEKLTPGQQFRIEPEPPIPAEDGLELMAVNCVRTPQDDGMMLVALLRNPGSENATAGYVLTASGPKWADEDGNTKAPLTSRERAEEVLTRMLETGELPDFSRGWQPVQVSAATPEETRRMKAKEEQAANMGINKSGKK